MHAQISTDLQQSRKFQDLAQCRQRARLARYASPSVIDCFLELKAKATTAELVHDSLRDDTTIDGVIVRNR